MPDILVYTLVGLAGVAIVYTALRVVWRGVGYYKVRKAGPRPLFGVHHVLWRDPGDVERLDLAGGPGGADGAPSPPFEFLEESQSGSQPCISVRDGRSHRWRVKWGS